jgi:hypothetical protein
MMIVRLFCPKCAYAVSKKLVDYAEIDVYSPMSRLSDSGKYQVACGHGHTSTVVLNNLKFELLFEMGINAIVDGYAREAVSSFSAALERFYEFYWRVALTHLSIPEEKLAAAWKVLSRQSERQLGAYVSASLALTKEPPRLLSPNKEVEFRNNVIHKGYVPMDEEATEFGDAVMVLITEELEKLRRIAPKALESVYKGLLPKNEETSEDEIVGGVNILTAIDVMNPPKPGDQRGTTLSSHFARVLSEREPRRMALLSKEEMVRRFPSAAAFRAFLPAGNRRASIPPRRSHAQTCIP